MKIEVTQPDPTQLTVPANDPEGLTRQILPGTHMVLRVVIADAPSENELSKLACQIASSLSVKEQEPVCFKLYTVETYGILFVYFPTQHPVLSDIDLLKHKLKGLATDLTSQA